MQFEDLGLAEPLLRAVKSAGYSTPTPIQAKAIPAVLTGGDILAGAQTGTGKTAGFTLPILHRLHTEPRAVKSPAPRVLVLTPTRELAAQVEESVRTYGQHLPYRSTVIFGGVGMHPQIAALRKGVDIVVATPGRLLDLHGQRACDLSKIEILVLDEADRMLDMGFIHDIKKVLALLPAQANGKRRQNLLFSATYSDEIKQLADRLLDNPTLIEVARRNTTAELVTQRVHMVDRDQKRNLLAHLIKEHQWFQVLVFTRTKHGANRLAEQLEKDDIPSMAIHGNKSQGARTKALADFKANKLQVLVATDIAARGIDIDQLEHVVNYDLPNVPEDYVHRIGRTGRAGATGEAISLVTVDELGFLADIEKLTKQTITRVDVPGFEADLSVRPEPIKMGRTSLNGALKSARVAAPPRAAKPAKAVPRAARPPQPSTGRPHPSERAQANARPPQGQQPRAQRGQPQGERTVSGASATPQAHQPKPRPQGVRSGPTQPRSQPNASQRSRQGDERGRDRAERGNPFTQGADSRASDNRRSPAPSPASGGLAGVMKRAGLPPARTYGDMQNQSYNARRGR